MVHGTQQNSNGLILGVRPEIATHMLVPQELLQQNHLGNRILQHALPSPQSDFISNGGPFPPHSTPTTLPQVSFFQQNNVMAVCPCTGFDGYSFHPNLVIYWGPHNLSAWKHVKFFHLQIFKLLVLSKFLVFSELHVRFSTICLASDLFILAGKRIQYAVFFWRFHHRQSACDRWIALAIWSRTTAISWIRIVMWSVQQLVMVAQVRRMMDQEIGNVFEPSNNSHSNNSSIIRYRRMWKVNHKRYENLNPFSQDEGWPFVMNFRS